MKLFTILTIVAAAANGMPLEDKPVNSGQLKVRGNRDQGNGIYTVVFDDNGEGNIEFQPLNDLNDLELAERFASMTQVNDGLSGRDLTKRGSTTCHGNGDRGDIDRANWELANSMGSARFFSARAWAWVHWGSAVAYFCPYSPVTVSRDFMFEVMGWVTKDCGAADAYGWHRCRSGACPADLAVGRTASGSGFCE